MRPEDLPAWPMLPEPIRMAILLLIDAVGDIPV